MLLNNMSLLYFMLSLHPLLLPSCWTDKTSLPVITYNKNHQKQKNYRAAFMPELMWPALFYSILKKAQFGMKTWISKTQPCIAEPLIDQLVTAACN